MKTIFVTTLEFMGNGGSLEKGRDIYIQKLDSPCFHCVKCGEFDKFNSVAPDMIIVRQPNKSFPLYADICYVEIGCTPIYV